jgi:hypothetical protein
MRINAFNTKGLMNLTVVFHKKERKMRTFLEDNWEMWVTVFIFLRHFSDKSESEQRP